MDFSVAAGSERVILEKVNAKIFFLQNYALYIPLKTPKI